MITGFNVAGLFEPLLKTLFTTIFLIIFCFVSWTNYNFIILAKKFFSRFTCYQLLIFYSKPLSSTSSSAKQTIEVDRSARFHDNFHRSLMNITHTIPLSTFLFHSTPPKNYFIFYILITRYQIVFCLSNQ